MRKGIHTVPCGIHPVHPDLCWLERSLSNGMWLPRCLSLRTW
jgi:hypothetical protein